MIGSIRRTCGFAWGTVMLAEKAREWCGARSARKDGRRTAVDKEDRETRIGWSDIVLYRGRGRVARVGLPDRLSRQLARRARVARDWLSGGDSDRLTC